MIISEPVNNQQSTVHNPNEIKKLRRTFNSTIWSEQPEMNSTWAVFEEKQKELQKFWQGKYKRIKKKERKPESQCGLGEKLSAEKEVMTNGEPKKWKRE